MKGICYLCKEEKHLTEEHVIPQCLGGFLRKYLYCSTCNNQAGECIDARLAASFARYATLLNVKRERGKNQPFSILDEITGIELEFHDGAFRRKNPDVGEFVKDAKGNIKSIEVKARSKEELTSITEGLAKSHKLKEGGFTYERVEMPAPVDEVDLILTGHDLYRGIAKISYGFACIKLPTEMVLSKSFDKVRGYILGSHSEKLASLNYESTDFMTDNQRPLNKIHLSYNRENNIVIGYVAIFGAFRYTILVADNLDLKLEWPAVDYTSDPIRRKEVACPSGFQAPALDKQKVINPNHSEEQVLNALNSGMNVIVENSEALHSVGVSAASD